MEDVDGVNAGYARLLLDEYLDNPEAVQPEWRALFETGDSPVVRELPGVARLIGRAAANGEGAGNGHPAAAPPASEAPVDAVPDTELLGGVAAAMALVKAHRMHGHLAVEARPARLGADRRPCARPAQARAEADARASGPDPGLDPPRPCRRRDVARGASPPEGDLLRPDGYEMEHIGDHEQRVWLRKAIESWRFRSPLERRRAAPALSAPLRAEGMERYLRRAFLGQKQFSLEGLDVLIPMLDESIELAAGLGAREVVLGMAHRGRLNVLAHTIGLPYEQILREFEGERTIEVVAADAEGGTGDVKYHLGAAGSRARPQRHDRRHAGRQPEPPRGRRPGRRGTTRAEQTDRARGTARTTQRRAADPAPRRRRLRRPGNRRRDAQPLRARGLLDRRDAPHHHEQPGRLHDRPRPGPLDRHSSDLAKGFDTPIIHVNADDPEAAIAAVRLALAYRERFGHDVVIDLVGYRRFGHNEQDEPAYTQPLMAARSSTTRPCASSTARSSSRRE